MGKRNKRWLFLSKQIWKSVHMRNLQKLHGNSVHCEKTMCGFQNWNFYMITFLEYVEQGNQGGSCSLSNKSILRCTSLLPPDIDFFPTLHKFVNSFAADHCMKSWAYNLHLHPSKAAILLCMWIKLSLKILWNREYFHTTCLPSMNVPQFSGQVFLNVFVHDYNSSRIPTSHHCTGAFPSSSFPGLSFIPRW